MMNGFVDVCIDICDGLVNLIVDLVFDCEFLLFGQCVNWFVLYLDYFDCFDVWELQQQYCYSGDLVDWVIDLCVIESLLCVQVCVECYVDQFSFVQIIILDVDSWVVEFSVDVDWVEWVCVFKVDFFFDVVVCFSCDEIQFGYIEWLIEVNIFWDDVYFESCGQQWMLLVELRYVVVLVNQFSYGYDVSLVGGDEYIFIMGVMV